MTQAILVPFDGGNYDLRIHQSGRRPTALYNLDHETVQAIYVEIQRVLPEAPPPGIVYPSPRFEYKNITWMHGQSPPITKLNAEGWQLVGWPEPVYEGVAVHWYATLQREVTP